MNRKYGFYFALSVLVLASIACGAPVESTQGTEEVGTTPEVDGAADTQATESDEADPQPTAEGSPQSGADQNGAAMAANLPEIDPFDYTGNISTSGSFSIAQLAEAAAKEFRGNGFSGEFAIQAVGTGAGFNEFCVAGGSLAVMASRPISDQELVACQNSGRDPLEFQVATSGLAVVVNARNDFLTEISMEDLAAVLTGRASLWSDVNANWPAEPILVYAPGIESAAFDLLENEVAADAPVQSTLLNDREELVRGVLASPYAIGLLEHSYYHQYQNALVLVPLEGVSLSAETAADGSYPLAQNLYIYTTQQVLIDNPQMAAFLNFFLTHVGELITDLGMFPAPQEAFQAAVQNWLVALDMEDFAPTTGGDEQDEGEELAPTPTPAPAY